MHENPLLPNAKLKELYALMQRCRALAARKRQSAPAPLEAILAATMMHLQEGDYVSSLPGSSVSQSLVEELGAVAQPQEQRLAMAAGAAAALKLSGSEKLALAYVSAGPATARTEAGWEQALTYATAADLPLILVCVEVESRARTTSRKAITLDSMTHFARPLRLPVLSVDGTDAVAVYRVMQESAHRARSFGGVAVIWCFLPAKGRLAPTADPLQHMKRYLAARDLLPKPATAKKRAR